MRAIDPNRSATMRAVKSKNTKSELMVRSLLHHLGYRYRLHRKDIPGTPDIVFPSRRKLVFVHGCFWHGHNCKRGDRVPKQNRTYWLTKIGRNRHRDIRHQERLEQLGWRSLVIWECELPQPQALMEKLIDFLT